MSGSPRDEPLPSSWDGARVQVLPGTGVVDRRGDVLLVVPVLPATHLEGVRELVGLCRRPDPTGHARVDALRALLDRRPPEGIPGFALLVDTGGSLHAFVHGPVRVLVDGRAPAQHRAGQPSGEGALAEQVLGPGTWHRVTVAAAGTTADGEPALPDVAGVLPLDLRAGTVLGGGVTLDRAPAGRPSVPPAEPAMEPAVAALSAGPSSATALRPAVRFRTVLLGESAARAPGGAAARGRRRPPLPVAGAPVEDAPIEGAAAPTGPEVLVEGVVCPDGHFTDPDLATCRMCGTALPPGGPRTSRPRPPLGILVTDGGTVYTVTGDFVIGREPERAPDVLAGRARPLPLRDAARSTSRVHAHLTVRGWQVLIGDDSSANGTFVSGHGAAGPWLPVSPQVPVRLAHGDRLRLGKRQLLFDTWRESVVPQVYR